MVSAFPRDATSELNSDTGYTNILSVDFEENPSLKDKDLVGYDGKLYDITKFARYHPGGEELLKMFSGKDVSMQVRAFHERNVMQGRESVGTYIDTTDKDPAAKGYKILTDTLRAEGLFETSYEWYTKKALFCASFLILCVFLIRQGCYVLAGMALALFFQQSGFFMHDFMHNQLTHNRKKDRWLGMICGTGGLGVGGHWWKEEHFVHHALTNTCDIPANWSDPQMREDVWAQNHKLFPFFKAPIQSILIKIQAYTWLPVTVIFGRIGITIDCFKDERRWYEWVTLACHVGYVALLMSMIPTWSQRGWFYLAASLGQGVLSIQLLLSHYAKPFFHKDTEYHNTSFPRVMAITTINIVNPVWLDWFHGGLNLHIEHHLFPCMPRHHFRAAQVHVKKYCEEVGLEYDECTWSELVVRTLVSLAREARLFGKQS
eukprot:TRINITY_DN5650_c0_g1_i1.p1 TRINITY_DN5650_c0_g1~~TRINITY_DN5650_c0_g1_i1.p1  ORF type:complete len:431 (+),score=39.23 TRINITY_DN5650_c0_g1_i1:41-1333(+)